MARTRSRSASARSRKEPSASTEDEANNVDLQVEDEKIEEEPPKPVSSESEADDDSSIEYNGESPRSASPRRLSSVPSRATMSRLFAPYRSLGIVTSGRPFYVLSHDMATMLCVPIEDRFQILSERLQPIMVSQQVSSGVISHLVADASLSVTVVAHDSSRVTLFYRTRSVDSRSMVHKGSRGSTITGLLHLGRMQKEMTGEKAGKMENAMIVAVVLARDTQADDSIPLVGAEDSDDERASDSFSMADSGNSAPPGQIIILTSTRQSLESQQRIGLAFVPLVAMHPPTYVNKIVVGGYTTVADGRKCMTMNLINIRSSKIIHDFGCLPHRNNAWITTMQASPAVDTIAVGTSNGYVHLVNLLHDKLLFSLHHKSLDRSLVAITSISFRTDSSALQYGIAPMAVGRSDGTVTVWDLTPSTSDETRKVLTELDNLHAGGVGDLQYLPHEPLLVSIGSRSNSIMMHLFDSPNHTGRILRQRKGHSSSPNIIRYLHPATGGLTQQDGTDASACQILSTGVSDRSLRIFSTARTVLDKEYSQGAGLEKRAKKLGIQSNDLLLPPVLALAFSESNRRDWGDLVTIHKNHAFAYVWSTARGAQSGPLLKQANWDISAMKKVPSRQLHATSVCMSACGHFALVGTQGGVIYKYNVQSGHARGTYPRQIEGDVEERGRRQRLPGDIQRTMKALEKKMKISNRVSNLDKHELDAESKAAFEMQRKNKLAAASHSGFAVTGLAVDSVNGVLISVGADKKLILWHFMSHAPHRKSPFTLPSPATKMCHIRESDLAAIAMEDFSVLLFDCTTLSIVRRFGAHGGARHFGTVTDLGFSPDGRTLYTASMDSTIRVYDVPTSCCIDWLKFKSPPTSISISPTGEYLATTHRDRLGISLWSDRSYYQTVHIDGNTLEEPTRMDEPAPITLEHSGINITGMSDTMTDGVTMSNKIVDGQVEEKVSDEAIHPKKQGLVTYSGLPSAHWRNLFHMELVKQRNKPSEPPKKPPTAPFFLQWRGGEPISDQPGQALPTEAKPATDDDDEWAQAWSDEDNEDNLELPTEKEAKPKRKQLATLESTMVVKRPKVTHVRSHLASLLVMPAQPSDNGRMYQHVTDYFTTLGPSAIDVALSSLCNGVHDLEAGLPLLHRASSWLIEAIETGENFEAINAYLHRFLILHATVIAEIEKGETSSEEEVAQRSELMQSISHLRQAQIAASDVLNDKMQHTLCLLRHFSRMI